MQRRPTILKSIAIVSSLTAAPAAMSQLTEREYTNENTYSYFVPDMPDFDQRRMNGLERGGRCYCRLAVAANLLAAFSSNGFPDRAPGVPEGNGWEDNANYERITDFIQGMRTDLGDKFFIGPRNQGGCGIGPKDYSAHLRDTYGHLYTIRVLWSNTMYNTDQEGNPGIEPHPRWLAQYAHLDGAIGTLGRRIFEGNWDEQAKRFTASERLGGHSQAVRRIMSANDDESVTLELRNSATPTAFNNVQDAFEFETTSVTEIDFIDVDDENATVAMIGIPTTGSTQTAMLIVSMLAIAPKVYYAYSPEYEEYQGYIDLHQPDIVDWLPELEQKRSLSVTLPTPQPITSMRPTPGGIDIMILSGGTIFNVERLSGALTQWYLPGNFSDVRDFAVLDTRHMFVASGNSLGFFGIANTAPSSSFWEVSLEKPISSIAIEGPTAYFLIPEMAQVRTYTSTESEGWVANDLYLPSSAGIANDGRVFVSGNHLFVLSNETVQTYRIQSDLSVVSADLGQPSVHVTDIAVDDAGVVNFVVRNGKTYTCDSWRFASETSFSRYQDHPLHGTEVSQRLVADRAMIGIPDVPDDSTEEFDESDITGERFLDCMGDLDQNRQVDGGDLGLLLSSWGQSHSAADINNDGAVDGADLGLMLGAWGACEELVSGGVCCESTTEPGCTDMSCQTLVCASDPYCCETAWDEFCVEGAIELCGPCE